MKGALGVWILAYIPCLIFAGVAGWFATQHEWGPCVGMMMAAAIFQPSAKDD